MPASTTETSNLALATPLTALIGDTTEADIALAPKNELSTISGTLTDGVTTSPIPNAHVNLYLDNNIVTTLTTATDGTFSMANVDPSAGTWTARFNACVSHSVLRPASDALHR